jgi:hypothetical protein
MEPLVPRIVIVALPKVLVVLASKNSPVDAAYWRGRNMDVAVREVMPDGRLRISNVMVPSKPFSETTSIVLLA